MKRRWKPRKPRVEFKGEVTKLVLYVCRVTQVDRTAAMLNAWEVVGPRYKYKPGPHLKQGDPQLFASISPGPGVSVKGGWKTIRWGSPILLWTWSEVRSRSIVECLHVEVLPT